MQHKDFLEAEEEDTKHMSTSAPPLEHFKVIPSSTIPFASPEPAMTDYVSTSLCVLAVTLTLSYAQQTVYVSNLDTSCLKCICTAATGCDERYDCSPEGYCGPFFISRKYWEEAGRESLSTRYQDTSHESCARDIHCSTRVVINYMHRFGRDCNDDGVTDCEDYARIHYLGGARCASNIDRTTYFRDFLTCKPSIRDIAPSRI